MIRFTRNFMVLALVPAIAACGSDDTSVPDAPVETKTSMVRVIHASHDAPPVDIWVDGVVAIRSLSFGASSGYAELPAGARQIDVSATGSSRAILSLKPELMQDRSYTAVAVGSAASLDVVLLDDALQVSSNIAYVRFLHASEDAPAVDIKAGPADGPALFGDVKFKESSSYVGVPAGSYALVVTAAGGKEAVVAFDPVALQPGQILTVIAKGTLSEVDSYPFVVTAFSDDGAGDRGAKLRIKSENVEPPVEKKYARVMAIHASPDAPAVDIWVDDTRGAEGLAFPSNTGYLEVEAGERRVRVNASGSAASVIDAMVNLERDKSYSVFATGILDDLQPLVLEDNLAAPADGKAHVRFVHLSPDAPAVDIALKDGPVLIPNKAFREHIDFTPLDAGAYDLEVRVADTDVVALPLPGIRLEAGKIYTVFARGLLAGDGDKALGAEVIIHN